MERTHIEGILYVFLAETLRSTGGWPCLRVASHSIHGSDRALKVANNGGAVVKWRISGCKFEERAIPIERVASLPVMEDAGANAKGRG